MPQIDPAKLRDARERRALTLRELADAVEVSAASISMWEQGKKQPRPKHAQALAKALRVRLVELCAN